MDADANLYQLREQAEKLFGEEVAVEDLTDEAAADFEEAREKLEAEGKDPKIVAVSSEVVQRLRLGDKELRRRKQRRRK